MILGIIGLAIAGLACLFAFKCYFELWKWARQMQHARIAIAYKGKVKSDAPLVEWLLWANMIDRDKESNGRVIFQANNVRVALLKRAHSEFGLRQLVRETRGWLSRPLKHTDRIPVPKIGKWKATDETPQENKIGKSRTVVGRLDDRRGKDAGGVGEGAGADAI